VVIEVLTKHKITRFQFPSTTKLLTKLRKPSVQHWGADKAEHVYMLFYEVMAYLTPRIWEHL